MNPGPSLARMTVFPIASPVAWASSSATSAELLAGDHLQQAHDGRGVEEVHADDPLGMLGGGGDRGDEQ